MPQTIGARPLTGAARLAWDAAKAKKREAAEIALNVAESLGEYQKGPIYTAGAKLKPAMGRVLGAPTLGTAGKVLTSTPMAAALGMLMSPTELASGSLTQEQWNPKIPGLKMQLPGGNAAAPTTQVQTKPVAKPVAKPTSAPSTLPSGYRTRTPEELDRLRRGVTIAGPFSEKPGARNAPATSEGIKQNEPTGPWGGLSGERPEEMPYKTPVGTEGAIAPEQKKQGNIDALIVALGDMGASLMGPYQESWQAQLGKTASGMARSRVFAGAMEKALAGKVPDDTGLALLAPEQQIQVSTAYNQSQAAAQTERRTRVEEKGAETHAAEVKQTGEAQTKTLSLQEQELGLKARELKQTVREYEGEAGMRKAHENYYNAMAQQASAKGRQLDDPAFTALAKEALAIVSEKAKVGIYATEKEFDDALRATMEALQARDMTKLPSTTAAGGGKTFKFNPTTSKFEQGM